MDFSQGRRRVGNLSPRAKKVANPAARQWFPEQELHPEVSARLTGLVRRKRSSRVGNSSGWGGAGNAQDPTVMPGSRNCRQGRHGGTLVGFPARHACREQRKGPPGQGGDGEQATSDTEVREWGSGPGALPGPTTLFKGGGPKEEGRADRLS